MIDKKQLILILVIGVIFLCIGVVNATQVTMNVNSKHIIGMGDGNNPIDPGSRINVVYVISEREMGAMDKYITQEYPVSIQDYCKVKVGQKVTIEIPETRKEVCRIVKIW